jgi:hypothetical protein
MKINTRQVLKLLLILSWIIFVGVCIEAGGCIFSAFYTLVINPVNASFFWVGNDLSDLYKFDHGYFLVLTLLISIAEVMKACLFYLIVMMLQEKKLDISQPFSRDVKRFIIRSSWLALGIGLFSWWGVKYTEWFTGKGIKIPDTGHLHLGGADVWLFMSVILFVIAQIIKRGIEIQEENDLTV